MHNLQKSFTEKARSRREDVNFKTFKIVSLPTINSIIVSLTFITLAHSIATTDLRSKKTTRYSYKRCHNFEEYCI